MADGRPDEAGTDIVGRILGLRRAAVAAGLTNAEIAAELQLSPTTVKEHASTMFRKLGARNRADAATRAQRLGVIA